MREISKTYVEIGSLYSKVKKLSDKLEVIFRKHAAECEFFTIAEHEDFDKAGWFKCTHPEHSFTTICQLKECPLKDVR